MMKKFISIFAALAMTVMAAAQNYEYVGPFGMPYVSVNGGAVSSLSADSFKSFVNGVRPTAGLEIGTYVTPVWGFSVEGTALFGTTGAHTFVDQHSVLANGKLNLSNLFGGYKGYPRRVEVVAVPGIGWGHDYGNVDEIKDRNYFNYRAAAEVNFNLGENRAWQINVRPAVLWTNRGTTASDANVIRPKFENVFANLTVGVTYKFGNRRVKSHNFVTNNYAVTKADYDALKAERDALASRKPEVVEKVVEKTVEKVVEKEVRVLVGSSIITFNVGSSKLSDVEKAKVLAFANTLDKDAVITILGSADSKTGSKAFNDKLAKARAEIVRDVLVKECGVDASRINLDATLDATDNVKTSRSAIVSFGE